MANDVTEIDAATGATIVRDFTPEEAAQRAIDQAESAARKIIEDALNLNRATMETQVQTALQTNRDFLAKASPTNVEMLAQLRALTRQSTAITRLVLGLLDAVD